MQAQSLISQSVGDGPVEAKAAAVQTSHYHLFLGTTHALILYQCSRFVTTTVVMSPVLVGAEAAGASILLSVLLPARHLRAWEILIWAWVVIMVSFRIALGTRPVSPRGHDIYVYSGNMIAVVIVLSLTFISLPKGMELGMGGQDAVFAMVRALMYTLMVALDSYLLCVYAEHRPWQNTTAPRTYSFLYGPILFVLGYRDLVGQLLVFIAMHVVLNVFLEKRNFSKKHDEEAPVVSKSTFPVNASGGETGGIRSAIFARPSPPRGLVQPTPGSLPPASQWEQWEAVPLDEPTAAAAAQDTLSRQLAAALEAKENGNKPFDVDQEMSDFEKALAQTRALGNMSAAEK